MFVNSKMILVRKADKSATKICIHHAHPKFISVTKSVVETIEFWWQILVATIILAFHIFRMFGIATLIFIVFMKRKKYKKKKSLFLEVTIDTFVGCPLFLFSVLPLQLYFAFPGSRT